MESCFEDLSEAAPLPAEVDRAHRDKRLAVEADTNRLRRAADVLGFVHIINDMICYEIVGFASGVEYHFDIYRFRH